MTRCLMLVLIAITVVAAPAALVQTASAQERGVRVYDETGSSLSPPQIAELERRLAALKRVGADGFVLVRAIDATPEGTLDQVEQLQQRWVRETGADEDTAFAILINRNPDDENDARAGIFVGKTYQDGNVPEDEQRAIVDDALIPPLRDGDVNKSFTDGLERLQSSIVNGPPTTAFEDFSAGAVDGWLGWTLVALALAALGGTLTLNRRREGTDLPDEEPRTIRPDDLSLELVGALTAGRPTVLAMPAALLELSARGAVVIESTPPEGRRKTPGVQVRLLDRSLVRGPLEELVWDRLEKLVKDGVVRRGALKQLTTDLKPVQRLARSGMEERGWNRTSSDLPRVGLWAIEVLALALAVFGIAVVVSAGGGVVGIVGVVALALVGALALVLALTWPTLSRAGQEAAIPWKAYKAGIEQAAEQQSMSLDLDAVLPDAVVMALGGKLKSRIEAATAQGVTLEAFRGADSSQYATFAMWTAFSRDTSPASSGSGGGTVSGGGAGGGGGAAGST